MSAPSNKSKRNAVLGTVIIVLVFGLYVAIMVPGVIFDMTWIDMLEAPPGSGPEMGV